MPRTVKAAVDLLISTMSEKELGKIKNMAEKDLILLHMGLGPRIRNACGLWACNLGLLRSCGSESMHSDDAAMVIIEALWVRLQTKH